MSNASHFRTQSTQTDQDVLVKVDGVSKKFCRSLKRSLWYGVQDMLGELNPFDRSPNEVKPDSANNAEDGDNRFQDSALRPQEFWAVKNVSFELRRGECLGLIGRN